MQHYCISFNFTPAAKSADTMTIDARLLQFHRQHPPRMIDQRWHELIEHIQLQSLPIDVLGPGLAIRHEPTLI